MSKLHTAVAGYNQQQVKCEQKKSCNSTHFNLSGQHMSLLTMSWLRPLRPNEYAKSPCAMLRYTLAN